MQTPMFTLAGALALALRDEPVSPIDLRRMNQFAAVAKKFVAATANKAALLAAWHELPAALQQRAMVIAKEQAIGGYFEALVRQIPEAVSASPLTGG